MNLRNLDKTVAVEIMGGVSNPNVAIPLYSSDDKAAYEVLLRMQSDGFGDKMLDALPALNSTPLVHGGNTPIASSNVSAFDICIEALKIKNIDVSEWEK